MNMDSKKSNLSWWLASHWYAVKEEADGPIAYPWLSEAKCIWMCDIGCIGFAQAGICLNLFEGQQIFLFRWQRFLWQAYFSFLKISARIHLNVWKGVKTSKCLVTEIFFKGTNNWPYFLYCSRKVHGSATDGEWHHICMSWRSSDGAWQFYKDGELQSHDSGHSTGHTIQGGGSLVLGQEQDSVGGGFDSKQSFQGSLTNVNVWSYVLSASAIKSMSMSRYCLSGVGNVYEWSDFIYGVKGKTAFVIPSPCRPLNTQRWLLRGARHTVFNLCEKKIWPV